MASVRARVVYASPTADCRARAGRRLDGGPRRFAWRRAGRNRASRRRRRRSRPGCIRSTTRCSIADGNLYVTYSGTRGQQVPVSIFRVGPTARRESFVSGIVNPTSMAFDAAGQLYVSSRFEGSVYRLERGRHRAALRHRSRRRCGLAFASDGTLFVGDRSGTIFAVDRRRPHARPSPRCRRASPPSTSPSAVTTCCTSRRRRWHRTTRSTGSTPTAASTTLPHRFGRPQGLAVDRSGALYVVEALAGASGLYRVPEEGEPELYLAGPRLVGVAFDGKGTLVVCSNETAYRLPAAG